LAVVVLLVWGFLQITGGGKKIRLVHSRNSIAATSSGRAHTHFFIFSASKISRHLARPVSGKFTNGHLSVISGFSFS
jgi:hypothetical protein